MARFPNVKDPKPKKLDRFLGQNESVSEISIKFGEWPKGYNFRVTKDYKAQKRPGHFEFINFGAGNVQAVWYGQIDGKEILLSCWNGQVYEYDMSAVTDKVAIADLITDGVVTILGAITDVKTSIFWFDSKIHFINGTDYKEYDGTTYQDVVATVPQVVINSDPLGGGTLFQEVNLLTGAKSMTFFGDGTALYQLPEDNIDADILIVTVDGVTKVENVDFTVNRTLGQILFSSNPAIEANVFVRWVKAEAGNADLVKNHKFITAFGKSNDSVLFMFGNDNERNVFRFSGLKDAGYFAVNAFVGVATDEFAVTDMEPQYQSLVVFKKGSSYVINPTTNLNYAANPGLNKYDYGYEGLNNKYGNIAPGMVQLIGDNLVTLDGFTIREFESTRGVRNEVEPKIKSERLEVSLQVLNLANAVTFDYERYKEYWVNVDNVVYIWNYGNDTMYVYNNIQGTEFIAVGEDIYFASNGTVEVMKEEYKADRCHLGDNIPCKIYGGFVDFDALELKKMMRVHWMAIDPGTLTSVNIKFVTDQINEEEAKWVTRGYALFGFDDINFDDLSFDTNRNPQVLKFKYKVKKFAYLQWIFENDTNDETLTILKLLMTPQANGFSG